MKNTFLYIVFLITIFLFLSSCDLSSPSDVDKTQIKNIFDEIKTGFNFNDLNKIMSQYHPDFIHNSNDWDDEEIIWQIRLNDFDSFDFSALEFDFSGDFATVSFTMQLGDETSSEPSVEYGDLSYFYKSFDGWMICGNEFSEF
ncbi:MAG: nuclear transport factor 2 family protein [Candidatus Cloacimonetes bacterium]|nr:nuclear transport factor 2 family protein [Candidatus Cloacimonadota bacterium]MCF7813942.1 nuclear transport factor 2 family protein [Candidatus Cloacimonadota bacterium]MCF7868036.1 nuclear transport factor 2 family protein [Candidatus Cloacimonadota bacterium]MCF7883956.1 nuclear transport factor 2 family protein [Candidatus Cloacimonadota bacterium]